MARTFGSRPPSIHSFIHSFNNYFLETCYLPREAGADTDQTDLVLLVSPSQGETARGGGGGSSHTVIKNEGSADTCAQRVGPGAGLCRRCRWMEPGSL